MRYKKYKLPNGSYWIIKAWKALFRTGHFRPDLNSGDASERAKAALFPV